MNEGREKSLEQYITSPDIAEKYDQFFYKNPLFRYDTIYLNEKINAFENVLDLGTGTGRHLPLLIKKQCNVIAVDISPYMLNCAKAKVSEINTDNVYFIQADMTNLPIKKSVKFDSILLMFSTLGMLPKFKERVEFLKDIKSYLKSEGRIFMHLHNYHFHKHSFSFMKKRIADKFTLNRDFEYGDHIVKNYRGLFDLRIHSFTLQEINEMVKQSGLRVNKLIGLNEMRDGVCESGDIDKMANGFLLEVRVNA